MNGDIRPPQRPTQLPPVQPQPAPVAATPPQATPAQPAPEAPSSPTPKKRRKWPWVVGILGTLVVLAALAAFATWSWYTQQLQAVNPASKEQVVITIEAGSTPEVVAAVLEEKKLIRSALAFEWYLRLSDIAGELQVGAYRLSPSSDVPAIASKLTSGKVDMLAITFIPGQTLAQHQKVLVAAGFSEAAVNAALEKDYDHPLLAGKPAARDLEGYIYPETYHFAVDATPEQIVRHTFDVYYQQLSANGLPAAFKKRGLSLFQAITLASIIEKEAGKVSEMPQISQVFHLRLKRDMPLGSDPTYQYAADKTGQARSPELKSPYNTRIVKGLPPGPIASPALAALKATANPAKGSYVYFVHGDDGNIYFSHTNEEHEANVRKHCQQKCQIL